MHVFVILYDNGDILKALEWQKACSQDPKLFTETVCLEILS